MQPFQLREFFLGSAHDIVNINGTRIRFAEIVFTPISPARSRKTAKAKTENFLCPVLSLSDNPIRPFLSRGGIIEICFATEEEEEGEPGASVK